MRKFNRLTLWVCLLCLGFMLFASVCVYGMWVYYADTVPIAYNATTQMGMFGYAPEIVVPGGEHEAELNENHLRLIDLVLNESDSGYGLNYSDTVLLHKYLKLQSVVYSNQKTSGGHLKFILDPKTDTGGLYYCVEKVSDTEYYCYTFAVDDMLEAAGTQNEIVAYRTTLVKTNQWNATVSYLGYAKVLDITDIGISAHPQCEDYSIDVRSWHV